jgi:hypothetical protein
MRGVPTRELICVNHVQDGNTLLTFRSASDDLPAPERRGAYYNDLTYALHNLLSETQR